MATAESVKQKIQGLISNANNTTGNTDATLTNAVNSLIAGFGTGENEIVQFIENKITNFSNEELTAISDYGLAGKTNMQSLYIPNVVSVGGYAFDGCETITEIHFEKHITFKSERRPYMALRGAINAVKIEFNDGFTVLMSFVFSNMTNLKAVIIRGDNVSQLNNGNHFNGSSIANGTGYIYVPAVLVDQYKAATNWVTIADQIRAIEDYPEITGGAV